MTVAPSTGCVPAGHVIVGAGGSQVTVWPRCGTSPGGHTDVVGGAQGVGPHGPSIGGGGADVTGAGGAAVGGGGGAGGGGSAGAACGGATGVGTTVGGVGAAVPGCSSAGSSDVVVEMACAALSTLAVPSGAVGIPEQPAIRTEIPTRNVLTRITSTSLPESGGLVPGRVAALQQARAMPSPCGAKTTVK